MLKSFIIFFSFSLSALSNGRRSWWGSRVWHCSVRAEQPLCGTLSRLQMALFSLIRIPQCIWPEKVRPLFAKSEAATQCCIFLLKNDIWLHILFFFHTMTAYIYACISAPPVRLWLRYSLKWCFFVLGTRQEDESMRIGTIQVDDRGL